MNSQSAKHRRFKNAESACEIRDVRIPPLGLPGILQIPKNAYAIVAAHGSDAAQTCWLAEI